MFPNSMKFPLYKLLIYAEHSFLEKNLYMYTKFAYLSLRRCLNAKCQKISSDKLRPMDADEAIKIFGSGRRIVSKQASQR